MGVTGTVPSTPTETVYKRRGAGESLAAYDVVYLDGTLIKKADVSKPNQMPVVGIIKTAVLQGQSVNVWYRGMITNSAWDFTSGAWLFLMSGGVMGHNAPDISGNIVQSLGMAMTKTTIIFDPEDSIMQIGH